MYSVALVSVWELGEGVGPFLIAPLSELYGRLPVYHISNILFLLCSVAGALSSSASMLIAFRFLNGFTVSSITLGPAMVGDMFEQTERGTAMALLYAGPLLGPVAGPIIGGFVADSLGWRWTFWIIAIAVGVVQIPSFLFMRETSTHTVFGSRKRSAPGDDAFSLRSALMQSALRPARFLLLSRTVLVLSIHVSIVYGYLYVLLTTLNSVLDSNYGFGASKSGLSYIGIGKHGSRKSNSPCTDKNKAMEWSWEWCSAELFRIGT